MKKVTSGAVEKIYDAYAPVYDHLFGKTLEHGRRRLCDMVSSIAPANLLEVGVGTGLTLQNYPQATRITGIDLSDDMLDKARERAGKLPGRSITLCRMDAEHLQFPDGSFDCIAVPYVLSVTPSPGQLVSELRRVCKPGGDILILNHFSGSHFWWLLEKCVSPLARQIGFRADFDYAGNIGVHDWHVLSVTPANFFGLSKLVRIRND